MSAPIPASLSPLGVQACAYAVCGWPVSPLAPRDKVPLTAHGFKDATVDGATIVAWWTQWPDANIAVATGAASGLVVLDIDGPEAEPGLQELGAAVPTRTSITSRGRQLFFQHSGGTLPCKAGLRPKLDVRADGGYVVVPPSIHPSGHVYRWDEDSGMGWNLPLAPLPDAVRRALTNGGPARGQTAAIATRETIPAGERHATLVRYAGRLLAKGHDAAEATELLLALNTAKCRPPLDAADVARIVQDLAAKETAKLTPARSLAEILTHPDALKPPHAVVPGIAWAGRITLVAAREGFGKSTLFSAVAAAVTTGGVFGGAPCTRGTVLWCLVEEHLNDLVLRAVKFQTAPDAFHVLERPTAPLASLAAEVEQLHPTLVIVDTLHRFAARAVADASAGEQWAPIMTALDSLARTTTAAVLLSAQAVKSTGEYRDSTEIGHGVDVVLNLLRPDKASAVRRLEPQKARWELPDVTLELVGDTYRMGGTVTKKLSKQRQTVLDALEPPMSYTEWQEASGVPERTFSRALKHLLAERYVRKTASDEYESTAIFGVAVPRGAPSPLAALSVTNGHQDDADERAPR